MSFCLRVFHNIAQWCNLIIIGIRRLNRFGGSQRALDWVSVGHGDFATQRYRARREANVPIYRSVRPHLREVKCASVKYSVKAADTANPNREKDLMPPCKTSTILHILACPCGCWSTRLPEEERRQLAFRGLFFAQIYDVMTHAAKKYESRGTELWVRSFQKCPFHVRFKTWHLHPQSLYPVCLASHACRLFSSNHSFV